MNKKLPTWITIPAVCVCSGLMLYGVNTGTRDQVAQQAAKTENAVRYSLVQAADHFDPLELQESRYSLDNLYAAKNHAGQTIGYVGESTVTGYGGPVEVTAGVDAGGVLTGISVGGENFNETPGLGGFTRETNFTKQFVGKKAGIKLNSEDYEDGVDGIAGATISSNAVLGAVNSIASYVSIYELGIMEEPAEAYMGPTVSATEKGFAGDVTVTAGLNDDGSIVYLSIDTPNETEGLGKRCSESDFTSQFIGKTGPFTYGEDGIEAISGATFTSNAAITALNTIVGGGGTASEGPVSATVQGFGGEVTVNVSLKPDNSIAALTIDTPNETDGLGKRCSESDFTDQFIGKSAPFVYGENGIEAISGATVTSTAVINALNELVPAGEAAEASAPVSEPAETAAEPAATGDGLSATVKGFGGDVTVNVTLNDDNSIASLTIDTPNETPGLGQRTSEAEFTDQFIGKSAPFAYGENGIEAISGATVTSTAVINALNDLVPAGATEAAEPAAEEADLSATVQGFGGDVTVNVTLNDDNSIASLTIDTPNETEGLGKRTSEAAFTDQFIGKSAPFAYGENGIEAISGATVTSTAVINALNDLVPAGAAEAVEPAAEEAGLSATVQGFGGDVTVNVTLNDDNSIASLSIDTPNETEGLGKRTSEAAFTDQFIGKSAPFAYGENGIEAITGATVTSTAVINALNDLVPAGATEAAEPAAEEAGLSATVQGFGGDVTVNVTLNGDNSIASLSIDTPNETPGLGQRTSEAEFTDQFIGKTAPFAYGENGIEAVTGATVTSTAVINALNDLVPAAETEPTEVEAEAEPVAETVEEGEPEAEAEAEPEAEIGEAALAATVQGFGGDVTINVTLNDDNSIASLSIDTPNETPGLGQRTSEAEFTDQFIGKSAPFAYGENGIEAISGATVTSTAVINALNELVPAAEAEPTEVEVEAEAEAEPEAVEAEAEAEPEAEIGEAALAATVQGFGGDVTVNVTLNDDNSIASLSIDTPNETPGLGQRTSEAAFTDQFIGKSAPFVYGENGIEAVTGATVTSTAVINALNDLVPAGEAEPTEVEAEAEPVAETVEEGEPEAEAEVEAEAEPEATEAEAEPEAEIGEAALAATVQGFGGDVTVSVTLNDDNSIASLTIDTPNETEGLGKRTSEAAFTDQFIGKTAPFVYGENGIEAVTGATVTSTAVINALNELVPAVETESDAEPTEVVTEAEPEAEAAAEAEPEAVEAEAEAEPEAEIGEAALAATVQGFGGDVTVSVTLNDDNSIATLSIDTPNETEGLGKRTSEAAFTDQFIGKSAPFVYGENGIEAVTGATVTSTAVINALNELVPAAEAEPTEVEAEAEPVAETVEETEPEAEAEPEPEVEAEPEAETEAAPEAEASEGNAYDKYMRPRPANIAAA